MEKIINFEEIYELVDYNLDCPTDCKICEDGFMQFLPGEVEYLSKKHRILKNKLANKHVIAGRVVWIIKNTESDCSFYKCGKCTKREIRPLDCRTYPATPYFKNNKICVKLSEQCPLVRRGKVDLNFIKQSLEAWKRAKPPKWWMEIYIKESL